MLFLPEKLVAFSAGQTVYVAGDELLSPLEWGKPHHSSKPWLVG